MNPRPLATGQRSNQLSYAPVRRSVETDRAGIIAVSNERRHLTLPDSRSGGVYPPFVVNRPRLPIVSGVRVLDSRHETGHVCIGRGPRAGVQTDQGVIDARDPVDGGAQASGN